MGVAHVITTIYLMWLAAVAGVNDCKILLYYGFAFSYYIFVLRYPIFKKSMEDVDGKEL